MMRGCKVDRAGGDAHPASCWSRSSTTRLAAGPSSDPSRIQADAQDPVAADPWIADQLR